MNILKIKPDKPFFIILTITLIILVSGLVILNKYSLLVSFLMADNRTVVSQGRYVYGENIDMSQILPESQHYVLNNNGQDLIDIAATLGINTIRITNAVRSFDDGKDSLYTKSQWDEVLNKMQSYGIKAEILIEVDSSNQQYYSENIQPVYLSLVQDYINSGAFDNKDVYAVDICNEPVINTNNLQYLTQASEMIKNIYPNILITVGWWSVDTGQKDVSGHSILSWTDYSAGKQLDSVVDFYSIHLYNLSANNFGMIYDPNLYTKMFLASVMSALNTNKSILIEEFGEANGDAISDQDTIGSPQLQAKAFQGVYSAINQLNNNQLMGSIAFDMYSRDQYPDAWSIVKDSGNYLYPAAQIVKQYTQSQSDNNVVNTAQSFKNLLLTNNDNNSNNNIKIDDRIGIKISLPSSDYDINLSNGNLSTIEKFHLNIVNKYYYVLFKATKSGSTKINIYQKICTNNTCVDSNTPSYSANININ